MIWVLDFWRTSIGGKVTMAITGVLLFLFVVAHLLGNLQLFSGPEALAHYAEFLHRNEPLLWIARIVLLAVFAVHIATGLRLASQNRAARPVPYGRGATVQASMASRSMVFTGLTLLLFVVYHLLHFTLGVVHGQDFARRLEGFDGFDVHAMVVSGFSHPGVAGAYALAQVALFLHLNHGIQSFAQTLGVNHARWTPVIRWLSIALATVVAGGNLLLALSVQLGLVTGQP